MEYFCNFKFVFGIPRHKLEKRASKNQGAIREDCKENGGISVKRLTFRNDQGVVMIYAPSTRDSSERLCAIEDILGDDYDLDRLREIVEADREGRLEIKMR